MELNQGKGDHPGTIGMHRVTGNSGGLMSANFNQNGYHGLNLQQQPGPNSSFSAYQPGDRPQIPRNGNHNGALLQHQISNVSSVGSTFEHLQSPSQHQKINPIQSPSLSMIGMHSNMATPKIHTQNHPQYPATFGNMPQQKQPQLNLSAAPNTFGVPQMINSPVHQNLMSNMANMQQAQISNNNFMAPTNFHGQMHTPVNHHHLNSANNRNQF